MGISLYIHPGEARRLPRASLYASRASREALSTRFTVGQLSPYVQVSRVCDSYEGYEAQGGLSWPLFPVSLLVDNIPSLSRMLQFVRE